MGVDNSGYFVVGNLFGNIDFTNFPLWDKIGDNKDISDFYYFEGRNILDLKLDWQLREPSGYESSGIFGYCLRSPSYGGSEYDFIEFAKDLGVIQKAWHEWTGNLPKVFLMNVQS